MEVFTLTPLEITYLLLRAQVQEGDSRSWWALDQIVEDSG
jgi:hypothetical protein